MYKAAVIGVGAPASGGSRTGGWQIGYTHAGAYLRNLRTRLTSAADINAANLSAFQQEFEVEAGHADYRQMLERDRPDVVSICTYVGLHAEMIEACAEAGVKAVLCEKPFLPSSQAMASVKQVLERSGMKLVVAHIRRYLPAFRRAVELYRSGAVGRPVMVMTGMDGWDLSEMGSHFFDFVRMAHGDSRCLYVFGQARVREAAGFGHAMEDHAVATFEFEGGGRGLLDGGRGIPGGITLIGEDGMIQVRGETTVRAFTRDGQATEEYGQDPASAWPSLWDRTLTDLLAWVEGGPEPAIGASGAMATNEIMLGAYLSALRGDRVDLPLADDFDEWPLEPIARRYRTSQRS